MTDKNWQRDEYRDRLTGAIVGVEVTPIDDIYPHISEPNCECLPEVAKQGGAMILIHSAFDGRELDEADYKRKGH